MGNPTTGYTESYRIYAVMPDGTRVRMKGVQSASPPGIERKLRVLVKGGEYPAGAVALVAATFRGYAGEHDRLTVPTTTTPKAEGQKNETVPAPAPAREAKCHHSGLEYGCRGCLDKASQTLAEFAKLVNEKNAEVAALSELIARCAGAMGQPDIAKLVETIHAKLDELQTTRDRAVAAEAALAQATTFTIDHDARLKVEWRGKDSWAVLKFGGDCLGKDGKWEWEPQPSSRTDEWIANHRFTRDEALSLARIALAVFKRDNKGAK